MIKHRKLLMLNKSTTLDNACDIKIEDFRGCIEFCSNVERCYCSLLMYITGGTFSDLAYGTFEDDNMILKSQNDPYIIWRSRFHTFLKNHPSFINFIDIPNNFVLYIDIFDIPVLHITIDYKHITLKILLMKEEFNINM